MKINNRVSQSVQSLSRVRLFATPWTAAHQASLSITNSRSLPKPTSIESKGMANHFSILALRTPWTVWKGKKIGHWEMNSPSWYVPNMLLEISGEITPERKKGRSQSKNNAQLWMWLVIEARCDAVNNRETRPNAKEGIQDSWGRKNCEI